MRHSKPGPKIRPKHIGFHACTYIYIYVLYIVCLMCSFQSVLCAVFSLCYMQSFVCIMCSLWSVFCAVFSLCHVQFTVTSLVASLRGSHGSFCSLLCPAPIHEESFGTFQPFAILFTTPHATLKNRRSSSPIWAKYNEAQEKRKRRKAEKRQGHQLR